MRVVLMSYGTEGFEDLQAACEVAGHPNRSPGEAPRRSRIRDVGLRAWKGTTCPMRQP
jgi:hypothetical protein